MKISPIIKVIALCLLLSGLFILNRFHAFEFPSLDHMRHLISEGGLLAPFLCILFFPLASILMLPNTLTILAVSALYSPGIAIAISSIGGLLAAYAGYYTGHWSGSGFLHKWIQKKKMTEKYKLDPHRHQILSVMLVRFLPIPYFVQSLLCGSLNLSPIKYGIASLLELIPWILGLTFLGEGFLKENKAYLFTGFLALALGYFICRNWSAFLKIEQK